MYLLVTGFYAFLSHLDYLYAALAAYLCGCFNGALFTSRLFFHDDVRTHGSGNAGSTNMLRNYGKLPAVATILGDMAKVAVAILLVRLLVGNELYAQQPIFIKSFAGLFCVLGHIFPCFFRFKGGKGVATCGGMVFMIDWRIALILLAVFFARLGFAAEAEENRRKSRHGKIKRAHARNPEYPENQERGA